jgi:hypothetical protein
MDSASAVASNCRAAATATASSSRASAARNNPPSAIVIQRSTLETATATRVRTVAAARIITLLAAPSARHRKATRSAALTTGTNRASTYHCWSAPAYEGKPARGRALRFHLCGAFPVNGYEKSGARVAGLSLCRSRRAPPINGEQKPGALGIALLLFISGRASRFNGKDA